MGVLSMIKYLLRFCLIYLVKIFGNDKYLSFVIRSDDNDEFLITYCLLFVQNIASCKYHNDIKLTLAYNPIMIISNTSEQLDSFL